MFRTLAISTAAIALMAGSASADLDSNADQIINSEEFEQHARELSLFEKYDVSGDKMIDKDELAEMNADQIMNSEEFQNYSEPLTEEEFYKTIFRAYDSDKDETWSQTEAGVWEDDRITSGAEQVSQ